MNGLDYFNFAIESSYMDDVERILKDPRRTFDLDHVDSYGCSRLDYGIRSRNIEVIKLLLEHGVDPTKCKPKKFHSTFVLKNWDVLELFLSYGVDATAKCKDGSTLLHSAVTVSDLDFLKKLLALNVDVNAREASGHTPLHRLMSFEPSIHVHSKVDPRDLEATILAKIKLLAEHGADLNATCVSGTVLGLAVSHHSPRTIDLLIDLGADIVNSRPPYIRSRPPYVREQYREALDRFTQNRPYIYLAIETGYEDVIECLLKRGANLHQKHSFHGASLLNSAYVCYVMNRSWDDDDNMQDCDFNMVKYLMAQGLSVDEHHDHQELEEHQFRHLTDIQREFDSLKTAKVCDDSYVTYHDLLTKRGNALVRILRNVAVREFMQSGRYKKSIVHFSKRLQFTVGRGLKRLENMDKVCAALYEIFGKKLQWELVAMIVEYLGDEELQFFLKH